MAGVCTVRQGLHRQYNDPTRYQLSIFKPQGKYETPLATLYVPFVKPGPLPLPHPPITLVQYTKPRLF